MGARAKRKVGTVRGAQVVQRSASTSAVALMASLVMLGVSACASGTSSETPTSSSESEQAEASRNPTAVASLTSSVSDGKAAYADALEDAGLDADAAMLIERSQELRDGAVMISLAFISGNNRYDYVVDVTAGAIVSSQQSARTDSGACVTVAIGLDTAEAIAMDDATVDAENLRELDTELDCDEGDQRYHVEFADDSGEYDYDIDAETAAILGR